MLDLTGVHDSQTCNLGANSEPCEMCKWANNADDPRERAEWSLESEMTNFASQYGEEALVEKIDVYMTSRGLY